VITHVLRLLCRLGWHSMREVERSPAPWMRGNVFEFVTFRCSRGCGATAVETHDQLGSITSM
jgi:hypothetical protein